MFHEEPILEAKDDDPSAEYDPDHAVLNYFMPHIYSYDELYKTIEHEWLHALFHWADEDNWDGDKDHYIMRSLGFNSP